MSNLRINTRSILNDIIPAVYIDNVILESSGDVVRPIYTHAHPTPSGGVQSRFGYGTPLGNQIREAEQSQNSLSVKVDFLLKDVIENNVISSWLEQYDFFNFLKVATIASTDKEISDIILMFANSPSQMIYRGQGNLQEKIVSFVSPYLRTDSETESPEQICQRHIRTQLLQVTLDGYLKLAQVETQETSDGVRIRNINLRSTFTGFNNTDPNCLDIFAFAYIDLEALSDAIGDVDFNNASGFHFATSGFASQSVIDNGSLVDESAIFREPNGNTWAGPVHQMPDGTWMSGRNHFGGQGPSVILQKIVMPNISVQDFRNVADLDKNIQDLTFFENVAYPTLDRIFQDRVKRNLTQAQKSSYFSDLYISRSVDNSANLFFSINYKRIAKENTIFSRILDKRPGLLGGRFKIISFKILRRRVRKPPKFKNSEIGLEVDSRDINIFDKDEVEEIIIETKQSGESLPSITIGIFGNTIRELNILQDNDIRSFSIRDRSIRTKTDGFYQYGVELEVHDTLSLFLRDFVRELTIAKNNLEDYLILASKPFGSRRDLSAPNGNPHIEPIGDNRTLFADHLGNYNPHTNRFTQRLIDQMDRQYSDNPARKPWIRAASVLSDVLLLISDNSIGNSEGSMARRIWSLCSPQTGSPDGIQFVIKFIENIVVKLNVMLGVVPSTTTSESEGEQTRTLQNNFSAGSGEPKKAVTKIKHYFSNSIFDSNSLKETGFHYLPGSGQSLQEYNSEQFGGVTTVTSRQFTDRHRQEVLNYFNSLEPELSTDDVVGIDLIRLLANIDSSSFTFLSTSKISTSGQVFSIDNTISDENIALLVSNILNLKSPPNEPMRQLSPIESGPEAWNNISTLRERTVRDNLVDVLSDRNCTFEAVGALVGDFRARLQEDERVEQERINLNQVLGNNPVQQLRENLDKLIDIHTTRDGDVFNPGLVFLKLIIGFAMFNENSNREVSQEEANPLYNASKISNFNLTNENNVLNNYRYFQADLRGPRQFEEFVPSLPLQIKSLFLNSIPSGGELVKDIVLTNTGGNMFSDPELLKDPLKFLSFYLKYMNIMEIHVLTGYRRTQRVLPGHQREQNLGTRRFPIQVPNTHVKSPVWQKLTLDLFNQYVDTNTEMFCRMTPYINSNLKIFPIKGIQLPVYDQFFIIKPSSIEDRLIDNEVADAVSDQIISEDLEGIEARVESGLGRTDPPSREETINNLVRLENQIRGTSREFFSTDRRVLGSSQVQNYSEPASTRMNRSTSRSQGTRPRRNNRGY